MFLCVPQKFQLDQSSDTYMKYLRGCIKIVFVNRFLAFNYCLLLTQVYIGDSLLSVILCCV